MTSNDEWVGRVAVAISSPRLTPEQAVWPWGDQARRVVGEVVQPLLDDLAETQAQLAAARSALAACREVAAKRAER
jgi:hypothetical protein